ncbi:hypothetical protein ACA910_021185 [Epithemia clementina (nom. ined.)]
MVVQALCITTNNNTFTVKVNLFAGELGYFMFEECGHQVNPTVGMKVGETYTFVQADRSNYYLRSDHVFCHLEMDGWFGLFVILWFVD